MQAATRLYTADDLLGIAGKNPDIFYELVEGVLIEMPPSTAIPSTIAATIGAFLIQFVNPRGLGYVTGADGGYILFDDPYTVRAPDAAFISKDKISALPEKYFPTAPDLVVEVVSPNDSAAEIHRKVLDYLRAGTLLVWVVYPDSRTVVVHTPAGAKTVGIEGVLDGGEVLPGSELALVDIFPTETA